MEAAFSGHSKSDDTAHSHGLNQLPGQISWNFKNCLKLKRLWLEE